MSIDFGLASIFSDNMIILHGIETLIWGTAPDGSTINIEFAGQRVITTADHGSWKAKLPAVYPIGSYKLVASCDDIQKTISNILAGEVWIAAGQSNMEWPLKTSTGFKEHIESAKYPQIRFFKVPKLLYEGEQIDNPLKFIQEPTWQSADREHVGEFSAVAYHFAKKLHSNCGLPVGIIECNLGGTSASAWASEAWLGRDPDVNSYLIDYNEAIKQLNMEEYSNSFRQALKLVSTLSLPLDPEVEMDKPMTVDTIPAEIREMILPLLMQGTLNLFGYPGSLYHTMVRKISPYTVKGVIYYQGESEDVKANIYSKLLTTLIGCWREVFENEGLWFLIVQLPSYSREGNPDGDMYVKIREQQALVAKTVDHTALAVTIDLGSYHDIHPRRKEPVGERLALVAREKVYGENIESSGPVYRSMKVIGDKIIVDFDHAETGLVCNDEQIKGFRISGSNRFYFDAAAKIVDNKVELSHPDVLLPVAVKYGWSNYSDANLYNGCGLPAQPFKTDQYL